HCRELCKILGLNICFDSTVYFTSEEHQQIYETSQKYKDVTLTDEFTSEIIVQAEELHPVEVFTGTFTIEQCEEIKIDNIFNQKVSMIIFVQHIFSKVKTTTTYKGKDIFYSYSLKLDNSDQLGSYNRTTSLIPKHKTLNQI
ncbi:hypothetical protein HUN28_11260, partial [Acinetobacter oleivorans]|nr:hypothetical protein [Acinetobacter oleivorans]